MNWPEPITIWASSAAPPSKASHVAVSGLGRLAGLGLIGAVLARQLAQGLVDLGLGRLINGTGQGQGGRVDRVELGHDFELDFVGQVLLASQHLVHVGLQLQVRLGRRAQLGVVDGLLGRFAEGLFDHLAHDRLAVHPAHMGGGDLARAEALELHLGRDLGDARLGAVAQLLDRHGDAEHPAEAFARFFNDLNGHAVVSDRRRGSIPAPRSCVIPKHRRRP
jgi:hypothetical protein